MNVAIQQIQRGAWTYETQRRELLGAWKLHENGEDGVKRVVLQENLSYEKREERN